MAFKETADEWKNYRSIRKSIKKRANIPYENGYIVSCVDDPLDDDAVWYPVSDKDAAFKNAELVSGATDEMSESSDMYVFYSMSGCVFELVAKFEHGRCVGSTEQGYWVEKSVRKSAKKQKHIRNSMN